MKKFAAHYLLSDAGVLLKNGIAVTGNDGYIREYIDTLGQIQEMEQMIFHSGLLLGAFELEKLEEPAIVPFPEDLFQLQLIHLLGNSQLISLQQLMDVAIELQKQYPEMTIYDLLTEMFELLISQAGYRKKTLPGLFLLQGLDLQRMHFTPASRLKKIL